MPLTKKTQKTNPLLVTFGPFSSKNSNSQNQPTSHMQENLHRKKKKQRPSRPDASPESPNDFSTLEAALRSTWRSLLQGWRLPGGVKKPRNSTEKNPKTQGFRPWKMKRPGIRKSHHLQRKISIVVFHVHFQGVFWEMNLLCGFLKLEHEIQLNTCHSLGPWTLI